MPLCHFHLLCQPSSNLHSIRMQCYSKESKFHQLDHLWPTIIEGPIELSFQMSPYLPKQECPLGFVFLQKLWQALQPILSMI
jgi:hypothetical protein